MKLKNKIAINLLDFVKTGRFDYLEIGATKEWILNNFPDPDFSPRVEQARIWTYGNLELHFDRQKLFLIYSDYIGDLDGGASILLEPWIFNNRNVDLLTIICELNKLKLDFSLQHLQYDQSCTRLKLDESGVQLTFHETDGSEGYHLGSFSLS